MALSAVSRTGHGTSLLYTALRVRTRSRAWGRREAKILSNGFQTHGDFGWPKTKNPAAWALMREATIHSKPSQQARDPCLLERDAPPVTRNQPRVM